MPSEADDVAVTLVCGSEAAGVVADTSSGIKTNASAIMAKRRTVVPENIVIHFMQKRLCTALPDTFGR